MSCVVNEGSRLGYAGVEYLHDAGLIHGDLKSANVLLKSTGTDARGFVCKVPPSRTPLLMCPRTPLPMCPYSLSQMTFWSPPQLNLLLQQWISMVTTSMTRFHACDL